MSKLTRSFSGMEQIPQSNGNPKKKILTLQRKDRKIMNSYFKIFESMNRCSYQSDINTTLNTIFVLLERLSMTFTGNGKRQDEIFFFAKTRRNLIF